MKTQIYYWIAILALILFIGYQIKQAERARYERIIENRTLQDSILAKNARIMARNQRIQALSDSAHARRQKDSVALRAVKIENRRYAQTIAKLRPLVAPEIAKNDTLTAFVSNLDSLIASQANTIDVLEQSKAQEYEDLSAIIMAQRQQIKDFQQQVVELGNHATELASNLGKAEKKAAKRWSVGVSGGYGLMSTGGEVRTGPVISGGISYRLFRF